MRHRHLDIPADLPVKEWPSAAIVDVLDRGDLDDWHALLSAVAADPSGPLARRVAALVDAFPMYGTSVLWRGWLDRCRVREIASRPSVNGPAATLAELRRAGGFSQAQVGAALGISQSDVSKLERRTDVRVSTLRGYLAAIGDRLRLVAITPAGKQHTVAGPPDVARAPSN